MERIQALIDRLYQQKLQNANHAQLLVTVELLRSELLVLQQKNGSLGTSKVAVTLPVNMNSAEEVIRQVAVNEPEKRETPVQIPPVADVEQKNYSLRKPSLMEAADPAPA